MSPAPIHGPNPVGCLYCGEAFVGKPSRNPRKWCSEACRVGFFRRGPRPEDASKLCEGCGSEIRTLRDATKWCSKECRTAVMGSSAAARTAAIQRHPLRRPCAECGKPFVGRRMDSRYCGGVCLSAVVKRNGSPGPGRPPGLRVRRAAKLRVFERDGWLCQLCGDPVDRAAAWPDPEAPVVDHWIPLALGGEHEPGNWVTAHRLCNGMKKAKHPDDLGLRRPAHLLTEEVS